MKFIACFLICFAFYIQQSKAQTTGNLTFSVTTTEPPGGYTGKNIVAIWIRNSTGTFVKTKMKYASRREQYLDQWISNSGKNTIDATTGATLPNHGTLSITWDGTNTDGSVVPDGNYEVWVQMTDANSSGQTASVPFVKGPLAVQHSPANKGNLTSIALKWMPSTTDIHTVETNNFEVYPNPTQGIINVKIKNSGIPDEILISNSNGRIIKSRSIVNGADTIQFDLTSFGAGIYFIRLKNGLPEEIRKIIVN